MQKIDISTLKKAYKTYSLAIEHLGQVLAKNEEEKGFYELETAKASLIQHFEYSFQLSHNFMRKFLMSDSVKELYGALSNKDVIRSVYGLGIVSSAEKWINYLDARNRTSHIYNEEVAEYVFNIAQEFYEEFSFFVEQLERCI